MHAGAITFIQNTECMYTNIFKRLLTKRKLLNLCLKIQILLVKDHAARERGCFMLKPRSVLAPIFGRLFELNKMNKWEIW